MSSMEKQTKFLFLLGRQSSISTLLVDGSIA